MNVATILAQGYQKADAAAAAAITPENAGSNGSEAWQAVQVRVDGRSNAAKQLKALDIQHDYYWGYVISPISVDRRISNYFGEEAWTEALETHLRENGLDARRVERLL